MEKYFMNVQANLIKELPKRKRMFWGEDEENVYFCLDNESTAMIGIPKQFFIIDTERLKKKFTPCNTEKIKSIIKTESDFIPAEKIGTKFSDGTEYVVLENKNWTTYVNAKLMKYFPKTAFFETSEELTAIRVYDSFGLYNSKTFIGIIMPCRVKE